MLLDGKRALSCLALAVAHDGAEITTAEGLAAGGLHPMQRAFLDNDAFQCGYCTPGQVCSAVGMVEEVRAGWPSAVTGDGVPACPAALNDQELAVLQSARVGFRGQLIGAVVAETPEIARHAASTVRVRYHEERHDASLRADRDDLYAPDTVNPAHPTDSNEGNVETALARAAVNVEEIYTTPMEHNNPMEPHATVAVWEPEALTLYDSTQGVHTVRETLAPVLGLAPDRIRVIAPHVGGGFGSKGTVHAHVILAAMAAKTLAGRAVKLALTRQQMFSLVGYRTPTIQRVR